MAAAGSQAYRGLSRRSVTIAPMTTEAEVRRRIATGGPITFAEFMEVALYWPDGGYYTFRDPVGGSGDYYTSPLAHPAFGALLAVQLFQMWLVMGQPTPFTVVELGAGSGLLCRDILSYAKGLPDGFGESLRYVCVDRRRVAGLEERDRRAHRLAATGIPLRRITGCVLSNELLDAFPVHQVVMEKGQLREVAVALREEDLVAITVAPSTPALAGRLDRLGIVLVEGQTAEINLNLDRWTAELANALGRGFVLTVDYGQTAEELYSFERRRRGTLTTFYRHLQTDAPLQRIGLQDITAQVDFTSMVDCAKEAGLLPVGITTQREFLHNLGLPELIERGSGTRREIQANRTGLLELVKPGGLGDFKVLVQAKNAGQPSLWGLDGDEAARELVGKLSPPQVTPDHLDLAPGHSLESEINLEDLWPGGEQVSSTPPGD